METARPASRPSPRTARTPVGNTAPAFFFIALYLLVVFSPLIIVLAYGPETSQSFLSELGKAFALSGFAIVAMQFAISSRAKWMEHPYGLDMIFGFHKRLAIFAGALLLLHPFLLAAGRGSTRLLIALDLPWQIWLGRAALILALLQIVLSAFRVNLGIRFEGWRLSHNIIGASLLAAAFVHGRFTGSDFRLGPMRILWFALLGTAAAFYGYHKFIVPFSLRLRPWRVVDVHRETHDVWTLSFHPPEGKTRLEYLPGQFQFITLRRGRGLPREEHPFSITSSPTQGETVSSSIKESGDFTSLIGKTRPGDRASIEAPFGRFSYLLHPEDYNIVFVAGGIGITPIMSMLRHMRDTRYESEVILLYANRSERDIAFRGELAKMEISGLPELRVIHILEYPGSGWKGEQGLVTPEKIARHVGILHDRAFYVCGPPPMLRAVIRTLRKMGVPENRIRAEVFYL
ncbi:MAG: ferredoxin reductase family protein [Candidatus Latescibacterota bacterium]